MDSKVVYEKTKSIAVELTRIDLLSMFIVPIKEQDLYKMNEIFEDFTANNPSLWERFYEIYKIYNDETEELIFEEAECFNTDFTNEMWINLSILLILTKHHLKVIGKETDDEKMDEIKALKDLIEALNE